MFSLFGEDRTTCSNRIRNTVTQPEGFLTMLVLMIRRSLNVTVTLILLLCVIPKPAVSYDFSNLGEKTRDTRNNSTKNLTSRVQTLRQGSLPELRKLEVDSLGSDLLWVVAVSGSLRFSRGNSPKFTQGHLSHRITGDLLSLDLYPLPDRSRNALLSVNVRSAGTVQSTVYAVSPRDGSIRLRQIDRKTGTILRPLGRFIHGQIYSSSSLWQGKFYRYRTTESGYQRSGPVDFPDVRPRLLSLTHLNGTRWSFITPDGNLNLITGQRTLDTISGNFGATRRELSSNRSMSKRPNTSETIRLAPAYLEPERTLAVVSNPSPSNGLSSLLFGGSNRNNALIRFFEVRGNQLVRGSFVGPLDGRIIDMDVPRANREQLLWLRVENGETFHLEMIDFSGK